MADTPNEFEQAGHEKDQSIVAEFMQFLRENKKWWMLPIIITMLLFAALAVFASTGAAPFIYTLF